MNNIHSSLREHVNIASHTIQNVDACLSLLRRVFTEVTGDLVANKHSVSVAVVISLAASKGAVNYLRETMRMLVGAPSKLRFDAVN